MTILRNLFLAGSVLFIFFTIALLNNHFKRELMYSSDLPHGNLICLRNEWNDAYLCTENIDEQYPFAFAWATIDVVPRVGRLDHEETYLSSTNGGTTFDK